MLSCLSFSFSLTQFLRVPIRSAIFIIYIDSRLLTFTVSPHLGSQELFKAWLENTKFNGKDGLGKIDWWFCFYVFVCGKRFSTPLAFIGNLWGLCTLYTFGKSFYWFCNYACMLIDVVFLHCAATKPLLLTFVTGCNWPTHVCIQEGIWSNGWLPDWFFWGAQFLLHFTLWYKIIINQHLTFKFYVYKAHHVFWTDATTLVFILPVKREIHTRIFGCPFSSWSNCWTNSFHAWAGKKSDKQQ